MPWSYHYTNILKRLTQTFMIAPKAQKTTGVTSTFCIAHVVVISRLRS